MYILVGTHLEDGPTVLGPICPDSWVRRNPSGSQVLRPGGGVVCGPPPRGGPKLRAGVQVMLGLVLVEVMAMMVEIVAWGWFDGCFV